MSVWAQSDSFIGVECESTKCLDALKQTPAPVEGPYSYNSSSVSVSMTVLTAVCYN